MRQARAYDERHMGKILALFCWAQSIRSSSTVSSTQKESRPLPSLTGKTPEFVSWTSSPVSSCPFFKVVMEHGAQLHNPRKSGAPWCLQLKPRGIIGIGMCPQQEHHRITACELPWQLSPRSFSGQGHCEIHLAPAHSGEEHSPRILGLPQGRRP